VARSFNFGICCRFIGLILCFQCYLITSGGIGEGSLLLIFHIRIAVTVGRGVTPLVYLLPFVRGGFRHVQPNRGPHIKGAPQKHIFFCNMTTSQKYSPNDYGIKETILCGLKLPDSRCCNSSVHCSTGSQNVDDDYCACRVKAVGKGGIHIIGAPNIF